MPAVRSPISPLDWSPEAGEYVLRKAYASSFFATPSPPS